jgi:hypothetical protein
MDAEIAWQSGFLCIAFKNEFPSLWREWKKLILRFAFSQVSDQLLPEGVLNVVPPLSPIFDSLDMNLVTIEIDIGNPEVCQFLDSKSESESQTHRYFIPERLPIFQRF